LGLGRIPWHECIRYAQHEGLDDEETESLIELVDRLDLEEHKLDDEKRKSGKDRKRGTDGPPSS
jgi:hypothetical protein